MPEQRQVDGSWSQLALPGDLPIAAGHPAVEAGADVCLPTEALCSLITIGGCGCGWDSWAAGPFSVRGIVRKGLGDRPHEDDPA